uniref:Transmembrane protein 176B n=1 Tax=Sarcophilus harrisii TaxID=9305 RepID=A0A7N4V288_SARHA
MSTSVIKVNGLETAEMDSQPTQINIHIHQESALAKLLQAGCSFLKTKNYSQNKPSKRVLQAQLALGVSLTLLGAFSCCFGIFLYLGPWIPLQATGCAFWAGAMAVITGAGLIIYEKYQSKLWGRLAVLFTLINSSTAIAALVFCSYSFRGSSYRFSNLKWICDYPKPETFTTWYGRDDSDYKDWRIEECRQNMNMFLHLFQAVQATLLAICGVILLVSLASLGVSLRNLCYQDTQFQVNHGRRSWGQESLIFNSSLSSLSNAYPWSSCPLRMLYPSPLL